MGADLHFSGSFVVVFLPEASLDPSLVDRVWWPADLEGVVRKRIRARLVEARITVAWSACVSSRPGDEPPRARRRRQVGIVIQAILRHSDVSVTRQACIKNDAVDPRSLAAMEALESAVCNQCATESTDDKTAGTVN
jgi:hypothetical protein